MSDYEGPLKMLQPKTYTPLVTLSGRDGGNLLAMNSDYWNNNCNNSAKMQVSSVFKFYCTSIRSCY